MYENTWKHMATIASVKRCFVWTTDLRDADTEGLIPIRMGTSQMRELFESAKSGKVSGQPTGFYIYIITLYQSLNLVFQNNGHRWLTVGPKIWTWSDSTVDKQILKQKTWNCVAGRQSAGLGGNFFQSRLWNLATLVFQELIDAPWQLSVCGTLDRWSICIQDKTFAKGFALSLTCWCIQLTLAAGEPLAASMA